MSTIIENAIKKRNVRCIYKTPAQALEAVKKDGHALGLVLNQTPEICMAAVLQNGFALQFVINQTPEICMSAVNGAGCALKYVKHQTLEIVEAAIVNDDYAIDFADRGILSKKNNKNEINRHSNSERI